MKDYVYKNPYALPEEEIRRLNEIPADIPVIDEDAIFKNLVEEIKAAFAQLNDAK